MFFVQKRGSKITIEVSDFRLHFSQFYYKIFSGQQQLLRKGSFNGPYVEIDLRLANDALFELQLSQNGNEYECFSL